MFMNSTILYEEIWDNTSLQINASDILNNASADTSITNSTEDVTAFLIMAATSATLGLMILITVIGNVFVIAAIILEKNLQNVANYLVASLAVADLLVACLVMPLGAVYEISKGWILGPELCDIWTSCDVLCCTASILHLVAIATDRYWAVTSVDYIYARTSQRVLTMIFLVWFSAVIVSLAPQFGWKDPEYLQRIEQLKCMVSQDISYQIFATCCTFYVPLMVILALYWKIYQTARKRIHKRLPTYDTTSNNNQSLQNKKPRLRIRLVSRFTNQNKSAASTLGLVEGNSTNTVNTVEDTEIIASSDKIGKFNDEVTTNKENRQITTVAHLVALAKIECNQNQDSEIASTPSSNVTHSHFRPERNNSKLTTSADTADMIIHQGSISAAKKPCHEQISNLQEVILTSEQKLSTQAINISSISNPYSQINKRKETLEAKRERKAAKTLAIITGAFVVCWLPFFLMALLLPLCESCHINDQIASLFLWLGYFNSTLNPVIYTIFSPEFRQAFKRILFGSHRPVYYRSR